MKRAFLLSMASLALAATSARAQSTIYGLDVRTSFFFTSDTGSFVTNYTQIATNQDPIYAIDFDSTATTLWGVDYATLGYGTFDLTTGVFSSLGIVSGPTAAGTCCSLPRKALRTGRPSWGIYSSPVFAVLVMWHARAAGSTLVSSCVGEQKGWQSVCSKVC